MIVKVYLTAFCNGQVREVNLPDHERATLSSVFYYGQNDRQPRPQPSVSVGDVIEWADQLYIVCPTGFAQIPDEVFEELKGLAPGEAALRAYGIRGV